MTGRSARAKIVVSGSSSRTVGCPGRKRLPVMNCSARKSKPCSKRSPTASARSSACAMAWATATPTPWKRWAASSRSPASGCGRSKPRRSRNCNIPSAASSSRVFLSTRPASTAQPADAGRQAAGSPTGGFFVFLLLSHEGHRAAMPPLVVTMAHPQTLALKPRDISHAIDPSQHRHRGAPHVAPRSSPAQRS